MRLSGNYQVFELHEHKRLYADIVLPYKDFKQVIMPVTYSAVSGKGEQRNIFPPHSRRISEDMMDGLYTPCQFHAGLNQDHLPNLVLDEEARTFTLDVDPLNPLAETDGNHRDYAITTLQKMATKTLEALEGAADDEERQKWTKILAQIDRLPISINLALDGTPAVDFVNLQKGRPVDTAHILSLSIQQQLLNDPDFKSAFDAAKELAQVRESPFFSVVRFDSPKHDKKSRIMKQIPVSTLIAQSPSDRGTSLLGLAKTGVGLSNMVDCVLQLFDTISKDAPELFAEGKVLTPPAFGGTKGSSTMLIGLALCLAHRCRSKKYGKVNETLLADAIVAAKETLDHEINGNFSSGVKRGYLRDFARLFFSDDDVPKHHGLPTSLFQVVPPSAFAVPALPKKGKPRKAAKAAVDTAEQVTDDTLSEMLV